MEREINLDCSYVGTLYYIITLSKAYSEKHVHPLKGLLKTRSISVWGIKHETFDGLMMESVRNCLYFFCFVRLSFLDITSCGK